MSELVQPVIPASLIRRLIECLSYDPRLHGKVGGLLFSFPHPKTPPPTPSMPGPPSAVRSLTAGN